LGNRVERFLEPDEFLVWCLNQDDRYELVNGLPVKMMTGTSEVHDLVVVNIISTLRDQLRGSPCRPTTADIAVRTRIRMVRRPDVTVTCGPVRTDRYDAEMPKLVVEVLSPSNVGLGWQRKLEEYRTHPTLRYILLVDTQKPGATLLSRADVGWTDTNFDTLTDVIELPDIACRLSMANVYEGIAFSEPA
jgi:Uma2 family endonuclease